LAEFSPRLWQLESASLIETHSEHIVNAIRIQAAEDPTKSLAARCGIFFLDTQKGRPQVRKLEIHSDGTVPEWPRSFFGEALSSKRAAHQGTRQT
jgi:predicted ATPase